MIPRSVRCISGLLLCLFVYLAGPSAACAHEATDRTIQELSRQLVKSPREANLYLRRGELQRFRREWSLALLDYNKAAELNSKLHVVALCRAKLFLDMGLPLRARKAVESFLGEEPDSVQGLVTRAQVRRMLGEHLASGSDYTRLLSLIREPGKPRPEYYIDRARVFVAAGEEHVGAAIRGLEEGIRRLGPVITLELCALDIEVDHKRYAAALERLEGLASRTVRPERWLARRGEVLEAAGRETEACDAYLSALKAMETLPEHRQRTRQASKLRAELHAASRRLAALPQPPEVKSEELP